MMRRGKSWVSWLAMAFSLSAAMAANVLSIRAQSSQESLDWLSPETLHDLNLYLPSYMPSVQAQMAYQAKVPLHQEITVAWSAAGAGQSGAAFVLVKRWKHMQKNASTSPLRPQDRPLLVIATTPGGEVRAFTLHTDTRSTTGQLDLQLPEDGQISRLIFLSVAAGAGPERIGELDLGPPEGTPIVVSKRKVSGQGSLSK
jgi:hypothetical protein